MIYVKLISVSFFGYVPTDGTFNTMRSGQICPVSSPMLLNKKQNGRRIKGANEPMFTLTGRDQHGVLIKEATKKGFAEAYEGDSINLSQPNSKTRRGRVGRDIAHTLTTGVEQAILHGARIRRLTPLECFRLQSVPDENCLRAMSAGISDTQLYKQAGNMVTVNVMHAVSEAIKKNTKAV